MHVRLLRMELVVDRIQEAEDLFRKNIVPLCQKQAGFERAYFLKDPASGNCLAMTFWASEADMLASERSHFFQEQVAKMLKFYKAVPVRETYEVAVNDRAGKA
jgi:heme-degrading monooxygenase HmoA